jgi:hypothetical protein
VAQDAEKPDMKVLSQQFRDEYNARLAACGGNWNAMDSGDLAAAYALTLNVFPANVAARVAEASKDRVEERAIQCQLLRCIFGNPFRPVAIDPAWLTWNDATVRRIAIAINDEQAFERLPILADALEDAGCAEPAVLDHLRGPGPHARGCFVVELLTSRK